MKVSIRNKIILGFLLIIILANITQTVAIVKLNEVERLAMSNHALHISMVRGAEQIYSGLLKQDNALCKYSYTGSITELNKFLASKEDFKNDVANFRKTLVHNQAVQSIFNNELSPVIERLQVFFDEKVKLVQSGKSDLINTDEEKELMAGFNTAYSKLESDLKAEELQSRADLEEVTQRVYYHMLIIIAGVVLLGLCLGVLIARGISLPLRRLTKKVSLLQQGEYQVVTGIDSNDEVGELVASFNDMVRTIKTAHEKLEANNTELQNQKEELIAQNEEILAQQDELRQMVIKLERKENTLDSLYRFIKELNQTIDHREMLDKILRELQNRFSAEIGAVFLYDHERQVLRLSSYNGLGGDALTQKEIKIGEGLIGLTAKEMKIWTVDFPSTGLSTRGLKGTIASRHEIYLPLICHSELLGVIGLGRVSDQEFTPDEIKLLESMSHKAAIAINNTLSFLTLQQSLQEIKTKSELVNHLNERLIREKEKVAYERDLARAIIDATNDAIAMISHDEVVHINKTWGEFFQIDHCTDLIGISVDSLIETVVRTVADKDTVRKYFQEIYQNQEEVSGYQLTQVEPWGRTLKFYTTRVEDSKGHPLGAVVVFQDITREAEIDRMKSEFVSTVSHELRTPLASILGFAELLLNKKYDEDKSRKYINTIYAESVRLTNLINDFLDLQKMESGQQTFHKAEVDLKDLVTECVNLYQGQTKDHILEIDVDPGLPPVWADGDKIKQVLGNLLSNAIKYSPGGGNIRVSGVLENNMVKVSVQDHGLGIPADALSKIFEKFSRVDNSDRRKIGGTGLGLAICKEIVLAHGGQISVNSVHGQGSIFSFTLPPVSRGGEIISIEEQYDRTILLVEDDDSMASLLEENLTEHQYFVKIVKSGVEALLLATKMKPQVIILDITLSGQMDGWEVLYRLKSDSRTKNIPVIISSSTDKKDQGLNLGAVDYFVKPFEPMKLVNVIKTLTLPQSAKTDTLAVSANSEVEKIVRQVLSQKGFNVKDIKRDKDAIIIYI